MIADTVFRTIGHARFSVPGTWRAGSDAVRQILRQQAGVDLGNTIIADGSGLSRHNLIAPATMMQVLQYIAQHDNELNFISMLPLAGHDGSLQYRAGLHQAGVDGKVSAKTGSLQGCITWPVSSRRPAGRRWRSCNTCLATPCLRPTSVIAAFHWCGSKADCTKTSIRTTKAKGPHHWRPFSFVQD